MGRIKTQLIKRTTLKLYDEHKEDFKKDYSENKQIISELAMIPSKKMKNVISGYITRLMKTRQNN
ncbi:30S ribosomal protein S17e [Candidatus Woesearchaeota archaeon]|nr:30S ribosomal protein S17e [Candidatus Woesearchaeota archaeon]